MPPRVQAAAFSTCWNRWTTARRFQKQGRCLLGCGAEAEDSIEHYCRCQVLQQVCRSRLNLDHKIFCNLHTFALVNPNISGKETLTVIGLLIYGMYSVTNKLRHSGGCSGAVAFDALMQGIREGARGHHGACRTLVGRWEAELVATPIPPQPAGPFTDKVAGFRRMRGAENSQRRVRARL